MGLDLLSGKESLEEVLIVAYSLEQGLEDFYRNMIGQVDNDAVTNIFNRLASIEAIHRENLLALYQKVSGRKTSHEKIRSKLLPDIVEGGLSTEEYLNLYNPNLDSVADVVGMAMSIEAQALDLYDRAARQAVEETTRSTLYQIASEETTHLQQLGNLMERIG